MARTGDLESSDADEQTPLLGKPVAQESPRDGKFPLTFGVILVLLLGEFVSHAETTLVFATAPVIASELGDLEKANWITVAYTLGVCATQPLYGKLSDIFGRKYLLLCGYTLLMIGCLVCGWSSELWHLISGRAVSGFGGAGVMTMASIIITDSVPLREVSRYRSFINMASTLGRATGGPLGGFILDKLGWRWLFWSRVPLTTISALLLSGTLKNYIPADMKNANPKADPFRAKLARIDYQGSFLISTSITLFLLIMNRIGAEKFDQVSILLFITLIMVLPTFIYHELYRTKNPIINLQILGRPNVALSYIIVHLQVVAQVSLMFSIPLYFQVTQGVTSTDSGMRLDPAVAGNALGAFLAGDYIHRTHRYKLVLSSVGLFGGLTYLLLLWRWNGNTSIWETLYIFPAGMATGMAQSAAFISMAAFLERGSMAMATGMFFLVSSFGTSLGVSFSSLITNLFFRRNLKNRLQGSEASDIIQQVTSDIAAIPLLPNDILRTVRAAFVDATKPMFGALPQLQYIAIANLTSAAFGFVVSTLPSILALFLRNADL